MPHSLADFPFGFGEGFGFSSVDSEQPQAGVFIIFVSHVSVVFVFFLLFFRFRLCVGARKAICLPSGDQAKFCTPRFPLVRALASPPFACMA